MNESLKQLDKCYANGAHLSLHTGLDKYTSDKYNSDKYTTDEYSMDKFSTETKQMHEQKPQPSHHDKK